GLGGRAADELVFGERTTGAEMDLPELTELARQMVGRWGMSDRIGPRAALPADGARPPLPTPGEVSEHMQAALDEEIQTIIDQAHEEARQLLSEHRDQLDALANTLLEQETLDEEEAYAAAGIERAAEPRLTAARPAETGGDGAER